MDSSESEMGDVFEELVEQEKTNKEKDESKVQIKFVTKLGEEMKVKESHNNDNSSFLVLIFFPSKYSLLSSFFPHFF